MLKQIYLETALTGGIMFILLFGIAVGIYYIIREYRVKGPRTIKRIVRNSLLSTYVTKSNDMGAMAVARFVAAEEDNNMITRNAYGYFATDILMRRLDFDKGTGQFNVTVVNQTCDLNENRCTTLFELTPATEEVKFVIYLTTETWTNSATYLHKKTNTVLPRYRFSNNKEDTIEDIYYFEDEEDEFPSLDLCSSLHGIYSSDVPKDSQALQSLKYAIESSEVETVPVERNKEERTRMFYLRDDGEQVTLEPRDIPTRALTSEQLDALYEPFEVTFNNEVHIVKASKMVQILAKQLWSGGNAFVSGVMGTGKTSFMQHVMKALNNMEDCVVINVMPSQIRGLKELRAQTQFIDRIRSFISYEENIRIVVFLDEAESMMAKTQETHSEDNTFIASLLDGEVKKVIHCGTAVTFNANRKELNPILFRSGRVQFDITVKAFSKEQASKAVRVMKAINVDKIFDEAKYNSLLDTSNRDVSGKEYCSAGHITLADISGCFMEKDVATEMIEAIRGVSMSMRDPLPSASKTPPPARKKPPVNPATQSINEKFAQLKTKD